MISLSDVKKNGQVNVFINQTEKYLDALNFTDHGYRHVEVVSGRCINLAKKLKLDKRGQEICGIAGFCHDMGNFMGRTMHHYWSSILFSQIFANQMDPEDLAIVLQAIVSHDKDELKIVNKASAILIIADKSDVHRSRVKGMKYSKKIENDIHERVNFATTDNKLFLNSKKKEIVLQVKIDEKVAKPIEYFEIFNDRMSFCRIAAKFLGYNFALIINNFKLS
jgi:metal-dependent HD superfamily phosphatase/phosphodiesterase